MKKLLLLLAFLFYSTSGFAQQKAVTEKGDEVLLYENGTWEYAEPEALTEEENVVIPTNPTPFTKDEKSSFLLKSDRVHLGFWINPKVWKFEKAKNNEEAEYELTLKSGDLYGMIITE
ncbi:MAG: hypothetical protein KDD49_02840, partial [Bacteroidetes bacterium]|nr:hypothetical protein [Bacteroidota bacterium]